MTKDKLKHSSSMDYVIGELSSVETILLNMLA